MPKTSNPKQHVITKDRSWAMFDEIAPRYDLLNRILSFGLDIRWRDRLRAFLPDFPQLKILDIATGTADVVMHLVSREQRVIEAVGLDMSHEMLKIGQKKIRDKGLSDRIALVHGDAQHLSMADQQFDAVTIAFGIRNIPNLRLALLEMRRVLRPGGRVLILEFSIPDNILLKAGHIFYLRTVVPLIGGLLTGHYQAYKYLNKTIEEFPYGKQFCRILKQFGFQNIQAHPLLGGVATIYAGEKL